VQGGESSPLGCTRLGAIKNARENTVRSEPGWMTAVKLNWGMGVRQRGVGLEGAVMNSLGRPINVVVMVVGEVGW
jgi:hypothetical protein